MQLFLFSTLSSLPLPMATSSPQTNPETKQHRSTPPNISPTLYNLRAPPASLGCHVSLPLLFFIPVLGIACLCPKGRQRVLLRYSFGGHITSLFYLCPSTVVRVCLLSFQNTKLRDGNAGSSGERSVQDHSCTPGDNRQRMPMDQAALLSLSFFFRRRSPASSTVEMWRD